MFAVLNEILHAFRNVRRGRCPHRPKGSYEFAEDFRKNGAFCRGDVGIAPYAKLREFLRSFRADKKIPRRVGRGQGCGIDGACRPGYEVRSHWISCTLSIAWGEGESPSKRVGRKKIRIGLAYMPCSRKKSCACVQSARTFIQRLRVFDGRVERERADFSQQLHGSILRGLSRRPPP